MPIRTPDRLAGPTKVVSVDGEVTIFTAPAGGALIRNIHVLAGGVASLFNLSIGAMSTGNKLYNDEIVLSAQADDFWHYLQLDEDDEIHVVVDGDITFVLEGDLLAGTTPPATLGGVWYDYSDTDVADGGFPFNGFGGTTGDWSGRWWQEKAVTPGDVDHVPFLCYFDLRAQVDADAVVGSISSRNPRIDTPTLRFLQVVSEGVIGWQPMLAIGNPAGNSFIGFSHNLGNVIYAGGGSGGQLDVPWDAAQPSSWVAGNYVVLTGMARCKWVED